MKNLLLSLALILTVQLSAQINVKTSTKSSGEHSESFKSFTFNGSWSWFSSPSAKYYNGKTYAGWVDNSGNITIGSYNHSNGEVLTKVIKERVEVDDRNNPSVLIGKDGSIMAVYYTSNNRERGGESTICFAKSLNKEDISKWSKEVIVANNDIKFSANKDLGGMCHVSIAPVLISNDEIVIAWNNVDGDVKMAESRDGGDSWAAKSFFDVKGNVIGIKALLKNNRRIHFALTIESGSIYYLDYKVNGKNMTSEIVYNAETEKGKAIVYDLAQDKKGNPVIGYVNLTGEGEQYYSYAKLSDEKWINRTLVESGGTFVMAIKSKKEVNPDYSGGMAIDPDNVNQIYLSINRGGIFEIEKWSTQNDGKTWVIDPITKGSEKNNVRPIAVVNALDGNPLQIMWMTNTNYYSHNYSQLKDLHWADRFQTAIKLGVQSPEITNVFDPLQIKQIMRQTTDWQFANPYDLRRLTDWHWSTFLVGLEALYDLTGEDRDKQEMINIGYGADWKPSPKILYVDMITIISNWAWLYAKEGDPRMIEISKWALDVHLHTRREYKVDVTFDGNPYFDEWWTWCDALFVAPPAFTAMYKATGEKKYLDYMDKMYWITADYLYSPVDSLMYRDDRYFEKRTENGKKVFWGRGNGWVIAGLSRIMDHMPADYPTRGRYEKMYKEMAAKLLKLQGKDGGWRVSLLDSSYQDEAEMSGSAFFVYALAWGLNNGLIDEKYRPQVEEGWKTLCSNINKNGRFGNVQAEGIDPRGFTEENWQVYGTGAFLMAGYEMYKLVTK